MTAFVLFALYAVTFALLTKTAPAATGDARGTLAEAARQLGPASPRGDSVTGILDGHAVKLSIRGDDSSGGTATVELTTTSVLRPLRLAPQGRGSVLLGQDFETGATKLDDSALVAGGEVTAVAALHREARRCARDHVGLHHGRVDRGQVTWSKSAAVTDAAVLVERLRGALSRSAGSPAATRRRAILERALQAHRPEWRDAAIDVLSSLRDPAFTPHLAELAHATQERAVAVVPATAIAGCGGDGAEPALPGLLAWGQHDVRAAAADGLAAVGTADAVESLLPHGRRLRRRSGAAPGKLSRSETDGASWTPPSSSRSPRRSASPPW